MKIKYDEVQGTVEVFGNFMQWFDEKNDALTEDCPLVYRNGKLWEIDKESVVIKIERAGFQVYEVDGLGNVETFLFPTIDLLKTLRNFKSLVGKRLEVSEFPNEVICCFDSTEIPIDVIASPLGSGRYIASERYPYSHEFTITTETDDNGEYITILDID